MPTLPRFLPLSASVFADMQEDFLNALRADDVPSLTCMAQACPQLLESPFADERNRTALLVAAECGAIECLRVLVPKGDLQARDHAGQNALMLAARNGHTQSVEFLCPLSEINAVEPLHADNALMLALKGGHATVARGLIEVTDLTHLNQHGHNALMLAAVSCAPAVEWLLPHIDPNAQVPRDAPGSLDVRVGDLANQGQTALMLAAKMGSVRSLHRLLPVTDATLVDVWGMDALMLAASRAQLAATQLLASKQSGPARVNGQGQNALMLAAHAFEHLDEVLPVLLPLCDPRAVDDDGKDALRHAIEATRLLNIETLAAFCTPLIPDIHGIDGFAHVMDRYQSLGQYAAYSGFSQSTQDCLKRVALLVSDADRLDAALAVVAPKDAELRTYLGAVAERARLQQAVSMAASTGACSPAATGSDENSSPTPTRGRHLRL